ncbi:unnamed protein product [Blepharisma stoltei]|uniref:Uncharacterized protein n=1 Tax=Blepharisma stoltei TaxID=1481888 RepID=A0AAU9K655_9CILI|nr:unnamed protein product [Blepharisma stoltei]
MKKVNSLKTFDRRVGPSHDITPEETARSSTPVNISKLPLSPTLGNPLSSKVLPNKFKYTTLSKLDLSKSKGLTTNRTLDPLTSISNISYINKSNTFNESVKPTTINYLEKYTHKLQGLKLSQANTRASFLIESEKAKDIDSQFDGLREQSKDLLKGKKDLISLSNLQIAVEYLSKTVIHCDWFNQEGKMLALKECHHLEKILSDTISSVVRIHDSWIQFKERVENYEKNSNEAAKDALKYKKKYNDLKERLKEWQRKSRIEVEKYEAKEKNWNMEKAILENHLQANLRTPEPVRNNDELAKAIKSITQEKMNLEEAIGLHKKIIEANRISMSKLQHELGLSKDVISDKNQEIERLTNESHDYMHRLEAAQDLNKKLKHSLDRQVNRMLMISEDLDAVIIAKTAVKRSYDTLKSDYEMLKYAVIEGKDTSHFELEVMVPLTDPLFDLARSTLGTFNKNTNTPSVFNKEDINEIDLTKFKYARPTFTQMVGVPSSSQALFSPPFQNWIYIVIRAIYDSKYFEHLMCGASPYRTPSRFTDFVYNWLGQFTIDETSRTVKELEWWKKNQADEIRFTLLLGITQESAKKLWELNTFREFLNEDLMLDELGFYMHCRYMLFKGPELNQTSAKYVALHYINLARAIETVQITMKNLPENNLRELIGILESKSTENQGAKSIECSLALRVMLEYYRQEKKHRYAAIVDLFEEAKKVGKGKEISYKAFHSICKNISHNIPESMMIKMYRDCWNISNECITADDFFLIANENGLFYNILLLKGQWEKPELKADGEIDIFAGKYSYKMGQIHKDYKEDARNLEYVKDCMNSMGICELKEQINKLEHLILHKYEMPIEEYWVWNLEDIYNHLWCLFLQGQHAFLEYNSHDIRYLGYKLTLEEKDIGRPTMSNIKTACEKFIEILRSMEIKKFHSKIAATKIQRLWRSKPEKNVAFIATVVKSVTKFKEGIKKKEHHK